MSFIAQTHCPHFMDTGSRYRKLKMTVKASSTECTPHEMSPIQNLAPRNTAQHSLKCVEMQCRKFSDLDIQLIKRGIFSKTSLASRYYQWQFLPHLCTVVGCLVVFFYQEQQQPAPEPLSMDTGHKGFATYTLTADISLTFQILHISILQVLPSFYSH